MHDQQNETGRYASAANTDVAEQVTHKEETMSETILPKFDRDTFMSLVDRLDPITQQAFTAFLERLATMSASEVEAINERMTLVHSNKPDELRLIALIANLNFWSSERRS